MRTKKNHINIRVTELLSILSLDHLNMKTFWDFYFKVFSLNLATLKLTQPLKSVMTNVYPWIIHGYTSVLADHTRNAIVPWASYYYMAQHKPIWQKRNKKKKYHSLYMTNCKNISYTQGLCDNQLQGQWDNYLQLTAFIKCRSGLF